MTPAERIERESAYHISLTKAHRLVLTHHSHDLRLMQALSELEAKFHDMTDYRFLVDVKTRDKLRRA